MKQEKVAGARESAPPAWLDQKADSEQLDCCSTCLHVDGRETPATSRCMRTGALVCDQHRHNAGKAPRGRR